jgi:hypothetical protein
MLKRFDDKATNPTRAVQTWLILIAHAHNRQTLTLPALAGQMHLPDVSQLVFILGHIMFLCRENQLPPLVCLVVNDKTGAPVLGMAVTDLNADREAVFNHDWYAVWPPTAEDLRGAYGRG